MEGEEGRVEMGGRGSGSGRGRGHTRACVCTGGGHERREDEGGWRGGRGVRVRVTAGGVCGGGTVVLLGVVHQEVLETVHVEMLDGGQHALTVDVLAGDVVGDDLVVAPGGLVGEGGLHVGVAEVGLVLHLDSPGAVLAGEVPVRGLPVLVHDRVRDIDHRAASLLVVLVPYVMEKGRHTPVSLEGKVPHHPHAATGRRAALAVG